MKIVDFILQHTKPQNHLLDLGCGPGLYTSLLADKDYMVTEVLSFLMFSRKEFIDDRQESRNWEYAPCGGFWNESEYLLLSQTFHHLGKVLFGGRNNKYIEKGKIS